MDESIMDESIIDESGRQGSPSHPRPPARACAGYVDPLLHAIVVCESSSAQPPRGTQARLLPDSNIHRQYNSQACHLFFLVDPCRLNSITDLTQLLAHRPSLFRATALLHPPTSADDRRQARGTDVRMEGHRRGKSSDAACERGCRSSKGRQQPIPTADAYRQCLPRSASRRDMPPIPTAGACGRRCQFPSEQLGAPRRSNAACGSAVSRSDRLSISSSRRCSTSVGGVGGFIFLSFWLRGEVRVRIRLRLRIRVRVRVRVRLEGRPDGGCRQVAVDASSESSEDEVRVRIGGSGTGSGWKGSVWVRFRFGTGFRFGLGFRFGWSCGVAIGG